MGYPTAATVINRAAVQCNIQPVADPFASTNPDFLVLIDQLIALSADLYRAHEWTHLVKTATFTTDGSTSIDLPTDFRSMIGNTLWNYSTRLPGIGPLSMQDRAALKARLVSIVLNVTFQIQGTRMTFPIAPGTGQSVAYDYLSSYWVQSNGATSADKDRPTAADDTLLFDEELLVAGLRLRFDDNRGFDTESVQQRFSALLEDAIYRNAGAQILSLGSSSRNAFDRMIDANNVPIGNWPS